MMLQSILFATVISVILVSITGKAVRDATGCLSTFAWIQTKTTTADWDKYNWDIIKTVGYFGDLDNDIPGLREYAHARGAKLVKAGGMHASDLNNATLRAQWIEDQINAAIVGGYDGVNIDYEGHDPHYLHGFNKLAIETANAFHLKIPGSEVSIDAPIYPEYEFRNYDYVEIAKACDYLFVMQYDAEFWDNVQCISPNADVKNCSLACSSFQVDEYGVQAYLNLGLPPEKLILGFPWYGLYYEYVAGIPFFDGQVDFKNIRSLIAQQPNGTLTFDEVSSTWIFHCDGYCKEDSRATEIWFDDAVSLAPKYDLVRKYGLKGVGMWEASKVDGAPDEADMWAALCPAAKK